jgi:hypothetical protein
MKKMLLTLVIALSTTAFAGGHHFQCEASPEVGLYQRVLEIFGHGEGMYDVEESEAYKLFSSQEKCESSLGEECEVSERKMSAKVCAESGGDLLSTGECARCY